MALEKKGENSFDLVGDFDKKQKIKVDLIIFMAVLSAGALLIANTAAVKLMSFFGVGIDGGVLAFPILYVLGDVVVELFGKEVAKKVIYASFLVNLLAVTVWTIVGILPAHPEWPSQKAYMEILGSMARVSFGSLIAFLASSLLNNELFLKIREKTGEKRLWIRSLGSSFVSKFLDLVIFQVIAFLGILSFGEFAKQLMLAYLVGMVLEITLTPTTYALVGWCKRRINGI